MRFSPALILAAVASSAAAQPNCDPQWLPGYGDPGTNGPLRAAVMWDQDGAGPQPAVLVVGGNFSMAGGTSASNIAARDPVTGQWSALGTGIDGGVAALAVLPNGDLVAAGFFSNAGGVAASSIARWNGAAWSALGSGIPVGSVSALAALPGGGVVVGGSFPTAGGVAVSNIAIWNGSTWSALGWGTEGDVHALAVLASGDVVAGGQFTSAGDVNPAWYIARWNGSAWSAFPQGGMSGGVFSLLVLPGGDLVAGGRFTHAGDAQVDRIARWNGSTWSPFGSGLTGTDPFTTVFTLAMLPGGDLVAGGSFTSSGINPVSRIARWSGSAWLPLGDGTSNTVQDVVPLPNGDLVAVGDFITAGSATARFIAQWGVPTDCSACDHVDFNGDGLFPDTQDIDDFLAMFAGGACPTGNCGDIDFNNDGLFPDTADIDALLAVFAGGSCA